MSDKFVSMHNLRFLLCEVQDVGSLTRHPYFEAHDRDIFDMTLDTAIRIARDLLRPCFREMGQRPPEYVAGRVEVHRMVRTFMTACEAGECITASSPFEWGGQQLPGTVIVACLFPWAAVNYSASVYPMLTAGAVHLIEAFGSEELQQRYIPSMAAGGWQGTMALTEPQAGASLSDITTLAEPTRDGYYKIRGQKIFISAGDHDGVDNLVHLMLASTKGAPAGVKGISLLVVPRLRQEGADLVPKDLNTAGVFHKLGYRGCPVTHLALGENDDGRGWLVGEGDPENRELALADATLYLDMFGIISVAWQWLLQGVAVEKALARSPSDQERVFAMGKLQTMRFFYHYELPKIEGLSRRLLEKDGLTADATVETVLD